MPKKQRLQMAQGGKGDHRSWGAEAGSKGQDPTPDAAARRTGTAVQSQGARQTVARHNPWRACVIA